MNSNDLMYYLKGFVDLTNEPPSRDQWGIIRAKVKEASPVETFVVDAPPMHNPINDPRLRRSADWPVLDHSKLPQAGPYAPTSGDCGCGGATPAGQSKVEGG